MTVRKGVTDAQIAHVLRQGLPHLIDPASLQDRRVGKEPEGTGSSDKGEQTATQTKRTHITSEASTTQTALLVADGFTAALGTLPPDDWSRTFAACRTIMLRTTSKKDAPVSRCPFEQDLFSRHPP